MSDQHPLADAIGPGPREPSLAELFADLTQDRASYHPVGTGDVVPDFTLPDSHGAPVTLSTVLGTGRVVVAFFRGGWCPYCRAELRSWQECLGEVAALEARVLAVSPQSVAENDRARARLGLDYPVLADAGSDVARRYGLVYELPETGRAALRSTGTDLTRVNGTDAWELPVPATYAVAGDGRAVYAMADPDFRNRAATAEVLAALV